MMCNERSQANRRHLLCSTVFAVLTIWCCFATCEIAIAQQNSRQVAYPRSNQAVSPARQAVVAEPMKAVPDFWASHSTDALLVLPDRLDRKNLPMLYHFSYDQYYHAGSPVVPSIALSAEQPQNRNHSNDLDARLRVLRESTGGGNRTTAPTIPSPPSQPLQPSSPLQEDSHQPAAVRIHRLPSVHGVVAVGGL